MLDARSFTISTLRSQVGFAAAVAHARLRLSRLELIGGSGRTAQCSGGRAPAQMGEPRGGEEKFARRPLNPEKRRSVRPSSRMPTTRHKAGFETGTHSRSPLQGAITPSPARSSACVPKSETRKAALNSQPGKKNRVNDGIEPSHTDFHLVFHRLNSDFCIHTLRNICDVCARARRPLLSRYGRVLCDPN